MTSHRSSSCKDLTTKEGCFFLFVEWHEGGSFDVKLTNCKHCWEKNDVVPPSNHLFSRLEWIAHAKEALHDLDPVRPFTYEIEHDGPDVQLEWTAPYDGEMLYVCACSLPASPDSAAAMWHMMSYLTQSYKTLRGATTRMQTDHYRMTNLLTLAQTEQKAQTEATRQREQDLFIKFTLVLNSKKERIKSLTESLAVAQSEVDNLTQQLTRAQCGDEDLAQATTEEEDMISDEDERPGPDLTPTAAGMASGLPSWDDARGGSQQGPEASENPAFESQMPGNHRQVDDASTEALVQAQGVHDQDSRMDLLDDLGF